MTIAPATYWLPLGPNWGSVRVIMMSTGIPSIAVEVAWNTMASLLPMLFGDTCTK
jgi:hypothetical protein